MNVLSTVVFESYVDLFFPRTVSVSTKPNEISGNFEI